MPISDHRPPNIVWLVSDHQCFGNRPSSATGFALQSRLANQGARFTNAYTALPICSPARASMLTGLYPHAHGLTENDGRFGGRHGLDESDWMVQSALADKGYRCAWFGKWHLHLDHDARDFGFEGFSIPSYGYPYGTAEYLSYLKDMGLTTASATVRMPGESGLPAGTEISLTSEADWRDSEAGVLVLNNALETHEAYFVSSLASDWIRSNHSTPFCLRVDPWGPHAPYTLKEPYLEMFGQKPPKLSPNFSCTLRDRPSHHRKYKEYWDSMLGFNSNEWHQMQIHALEHVALVEGALEQVVKTIDEVGLANDTYIIFTADHGDAVASNGGVANKGSLMVEETMRIPLQIRGPGISPKQSIDQLVCNMDLAPTILEMCGVEIDRTFHGKSVLPLLADHGSSWREGLMTQHYGLHEPIVQRAYHSENWKYVIQPDGFEELYDLCRDPYEMKNLATCSGSRDTLRRMKDGLLGKMMETGDTDKRLETIFSVLHA